LLHPELAARKKEKGKKVAFAAVVPIE